MKNELRPPFPFIYGMLLLVFVVLWSQTAVAQTVAVNCSDLPAGSYARGGSISIPATVTGVFEGTNQFEVYLSDASGNFGSEVKIGSFGGVYASHLEALIPAATAAGNNYKIRIKSTAPAAVSGACTISVAAGTVVTAGATAPATSTLQAGEYFGWCTGNAPGRIIKLTNTSTSGAIVEGTLTNNKTGVSTIIPLSGSDWNITLPDVADYTFTVKATAGGIINTKSYTIINNSFSLSLQNFGEASGCIPFVTTLGIPLVGITDNYKGMRYRVNWGDGTIVYFTHAELMAALGNIKHTYNETSCGSAGNSFKVVVTQDFPFNSASCTQPNIGTDIMVFRKPEAYFDFPRPAACVNTLITISNSSVIGNGNMSNVCQAEALFVWYVNSIEVYRSAHPEASPPNLYYTFPTAGKYEIKLDVENLPCGVATRKDSICIEDKPNPNFTIDQVSGCIQLAIQTDTVKSTGKYYCQNYKQEWTIQKKNGSTYAVAALNTDYKVLSGSVNGAEPKFSFLKAGDYRIVYTVENSCGPLSTQKDVKVYENKVTLPAAKKYCGLQTIDFGAAAAHKPTYSTSLGSESYLWTVTGGDYEFTSSTTSASKFPVIKFKDYAVYTVKVQFTNICGSNEATQTITTVQAIAVDILKPAADTSVCYNAGNITVKGSTSGGNVASVSWSKDAAANGTFANGTLRDATYTFGSNELLNGTVKLIFTATHSDNVCTPVKAERLVTIFPENTGVKATRDLCSGAGLSYQPVSSVLTSKFTWTAALIYGSASGFHSQVSESTAAITDVLVNASATDTAVVVYTITPHANGCAGVPYTFKVKVYPIPVLTVTQPRTIICSGEKPNLKLESSVQNTLYEWTSIVTSGTVNGNSSQATTDASNVVIIEDVLTNNTTTSGIVEYSIVAKGPSGCPSPVQVKTIEVRPRVTPADAGDDQKLCHATQVTLDGNIPQVGTGGWTQTGGPAVSITNAALYNTTVTGLQPDKEYTFKWLIDGGSSNCTSSFDEVVIYNRPEVSAPNAGTDQVYCNFLTSAPNFVTLAATAPTRTYESGSWTVENYPVGSTYNFTSPQHAGTTFYFSLPGVYQLRWIVSGDATCAPKYDDVTIEVYEVPVSGAIVTGVPNVCAGANVSFSLGSYTGVIQKWQYNPDPSNSSTWVDTAVTSANIDFLNVQDTFEVRAVVISAGYNSTCVATTTTTPVRIYVSALSKGGHTGDDAAVCKNSNVGSIQLTDYLGVITGWQTSTDGGTTWTNVGQANATAVMYSNLSQTTWYRALVKNGDCSEVPSDITVITVKDQVSSSNAGTDKDLCNVSTTTLTGNTPAAGETGTWTQIDGPNVATMSNAADPVMTLTGLTSGLYRFTWSVGNGACPIKTSTVAVAISASASGGTTQGSKTFCKGTDNDFVTLSGYFGSVNKWQSSTDGGVTWTDIAATQTSLRYTNLAQTTQFRAMLTNGYCTIPVFSAPATITIQEPVTIADAGADQRLCNVTTADLQANVLAAGETGTWTQTAGPNTAVMSDPHAMALHVSGLITGNYTFEWKIDNGSICPPSTDQVVIYNRPEVTTPDAGTDQVYCNFVTSAVNFVTLGATAPTLAFESGSWTVEGSPAGSTYNFTNPQQAGTAFYFSRPGTYQLRWTVNGDATCLPKYDDVTIEVYETPVSGGVVTGTPNVCAGTNVSFSLSSYTGIIQKWQYNPDPVHSSTWIDTAVTNPAIAFLNVQDTFEVRAVIISAGHASSCVASTVTTPVRVYVSALSKGGHTGNNATVCKNSNVGSIELTDYVGSITGWQISTDGGNSWTNIGRANAAIIGYSNLSETTWYRALVKNGGCSEVPSDITIITVKASISGSDAGTDQALCNVTTTILTANTPMAGETGTWTQIDGPSTATMSSTVDPVMTLNGLTPGLYRFTWSVENSVCPAKISAVAVSISASAVGGTTLGSKTFCKGTDNDFVTLNGYSGSINRWQSSIDGGVSWTDIAATQPSLRYSNLLQTTQFRAMITNGYCTVPVYSTPAIIVIQEPVTTADAGADQKLCSVTTTGLQGNVIAAGETGTWRQVSGPNTAMLSDIHDPALLLNGLITGNYTFEWKIDNGSFCPASADQVVIYNRPEVSVPDAGADQVYCNFLSSAVNFVTLGATAPTLSFESGSWSVESAPSGSTYNFTNIQQAGTAFYFSRPGTYRLRWTVSGDATCAPKQDEVTIEVYEAPASGGIITGTPNVCAGSDVNFSLPSYTGIIQKWQYNPDPVNSSLWIDTAVTSSSITFRNVQDTFEVRAVVISAGHANTCAASVITTPLRVYVSALSQGGHTGNNATVCKNSNVGSIQLTGYTGAISGWEMSTDDGTSWTNIGRANANTIGYSNLSQTTWYRALVKNGGCSEVTSDITIITVVAPVSNADAGVDQGLCNVTTTILTANTPAAGETGTWAQIDGPGTATMSSSSTPAMTLTGLSPGLYRFTWSVENGACPARISAVAVNISANANGGLALGSKTFCKGTDNDFVTLSGYSGSIASWQSSIDGGLTWTDIAVTQPSLRYSNLAQTTQFRAVLVNGFCVVPVYSAPATIEIKEKVSSAYAGTDQELCGGTTASLQGNAAATGETGTWRQVSGPNTATLSDVHLPALQLSGLTTGSYTFEWKIDNAGTCPATADEVSFIIYPSLVNSIDNTPVTVCEGQLVTINTLAVSGGKGTGTYSFQWQYSMDKQVSWQDFGVNANYIDFSFIASDTIYVRRKISSGPCTGYSAPTLVTVQAGLANNTLTGDEELCINTAAQAIAGSLPTGGDSHYAYVWEQSTDGGNTWAVLPGASGQNYAPGVLTATTQFRRKISTALCNGLQTSLSNVVTKTVRPDAKAMFTALALVDCAPFVIDRGNVAITTYDDRNSSYTWKADDRVIGSAADFPGYTLTKADDSVVVKLVVTSLYGCKSDSLERKFYAYAQVSPSFTVSTDNSCGPVTVQFTNTSPVNNRITYSWDFGNGQTSPSFNPPAIVYDIDADRKDITYIAKLKATTPCMSKEFEVPVTVRSKPKAAFTPSKTTGCSPFTVLFDNNSLGERVTYTWLFDDGTKDSVTSSKAQMEHTFITYVQDTFQVRLVAANECGKDTVLYQLVVSPNTVRLNLVVNGNERMGCAPLTVKFNNNTRGGNAFHWDFGDGNQLNTTENIETITHEFTQPGKYKITLVGSNGCSDTTGYENIEVLVTPKVDFTPLPAEVCIGDSIYFRNEGVGLTGVTWNFGDGNTSTLTNPKHAYTVANGYQVSMEGIIQYAGGNVCKASVSKPVKVIPSLPGDFTASDLVGNCVPFTITFTNITKPSALTKWDFGDGEFATGDIVSHTFRSNGDFIVSMQSLHPQGCTYIASKPVKIQGPEGQFIYDYGYICKDKPVRFEAYAIRTTGYKWVFGDGDTLTTTNNVVYHVYRQSGVYIPSVQLLREECGVWLRGQEQIKVDYYKAGFSFVQQRSCGNSLIAFQDTSRTAFGIKQWQWDFGDGGTASVSKPQHSYVGTNTWPVRLIIYNVSGCSDTVQAPVFAKPNTPPSATIINNPTGCARQPVHYTAVVNSEDPVTLYSWTFSNGSSANGEVVTNAYGGSGIFTAKLIIGTQYGCYDTTESTITVYPTPLVSAGNDVAICKGQSAQLGAAGLPNLIWTPREGLSCTTCATPVASPTDTRQYLVSGMNNFGCVGSDSVTVNVILPAKVEVPVGDTICQGQSIQLNAWGNSRYTWSPANTLSASTISDPVASPKLNTTYRVIGTDEKNCFRDTAYVTVVVGSWPKVSLGPDRVLSTGTQLPLVTSISNGPIRKWAWSPAKDLSCDDCSLPIATVKKDVCYTVTVQNNFNCEARDTMCIQAFCEATQVFIPNAFVPGATSNNILTVRGKGIKLVKSFRIFNRWGQMVFDKANFQPNDKAFGWDGKINGVPATPDVYVYTCEVTCEDDKAFTYKGNVAILK